MSSIVTYNGRGWCLLDATNAHLTKPKLIERNFSSSCYPSSASAIINDGTIQYIEGGCNRAAVYRMMGEEETNPSGPYMRYINEHGKFIEEFLIRQWKEMGIWEDNNVKFHHTEFGFPLSGEIDAVIWKPGSKSPKDVYIVECKTYYKWFKRSQLAGTKDKPGKPAYNNLFQLMLYLDYYSRHYGIDKGKLLYTARDEAKQFEFDVTLKKIHGKTYGVVDGVPDMNFTLENIIERFKESYDSFSKGELPPRDFKLVYDDADVEKLYRTGMIGKTKYQDFQRGKKLGDWQCISKDTKVLTKEDSWVNISDVCEGQDVLTRSGWNKVLEVRNMGEKQTFTIKPSVLLPYSATADHKILVSSVEYQRTHKSKGTDGLSKYKYDIVNNAKFVEVQNIDNSKYNYTITPIDMTEIPTFMKNFKARNAALDVLAACICDGYLEDSCIEISFGASDSEKEKAIEFLSTTGILSKALRCGVTRPSILSGIDNKENKVRIYDNGILSFVYDFISGHYSHEKCFDGEVLLWPVDAQRELLQHMLNYDGCVTKNRNSKVYAHQTTSEVLALQIQQMYLRTGRIASISKNVRPNVTNISANAKPRYQICVYPDANYNRGFIYNNTLYTRISKIEKSEVTTVYDIQVNNSPEFLTSGGIVHNCSYCSYKDKCWGKTDLFDFEFDI